MDKKLIFFLIFAFACTKDKIDPKNEKVIIISKANPIEFWTPDQQSFNQKEVCSIYPVCFCQPFLITDTIKLQFFDDDYPTNLYLRIKTSTGIGITQLPFNGGDINGYYTLSKLISDFFLPSNYGTHQISFDIEKYILSNPISNQNFASDLNHWFNDPAYGTQDWSWSGSNSVTVSAASLNTKGLAQNMNAELSASFTNFHLSNVAYTLEVDGSLTTNAGVAVIVTCGLLDKYGNTLQTITIKSSTVNTSFNTIIGINGKLITKVVVYANGGFNGSVEITKISLTTNSVDESIGFSDCIEVQEGEDENSCTQLIEYSNSSDFAGLDFNDESPSFGPFGLRIPAVFFDEIFPQEQEDLELSDDTIITLWSKIEGKKLLDIGFMPFYMHKKVQMVLMMDNVSIDGVSYRLRDPYQITAPASKRSALRKASVLLSEKDFIDRNLL